MSFGEVIEVEDIDCLKSESEPRFFQAEFQEVGRDAVHTIDDVFVADDLVLREYSDEIFLLQVAIDIMRNVAAFGRNNELFSLVSLLLH